MTAAKKKPATAERDGRKVTYINKTFISTKNAEKSNTLNKLSRVDRHDLGHSNLVEKTFGHYHRNDETANRQHRLNDLLRLINDRHGAHIPESDDVAYLEVAARAIDDLQFFAEWCSIWAPWATNKLVLDIFTSREISDFDIHIDVVSRMLNVTRDEYERLKLWNLGHVEKTQLERREEAKEIKRRNDLDAKERKRRESGIQTREEYLEDGKSKEEWIELGISRATYFRRKKAGKL